jgi:hypothetical protein
MKGEMYGPLTSDLANAVMADRNRYAAHLALEMEALRSRPSKPRARIRGRSIIGLLGYVLAGARAALSGPRPSTSAY